MKTVALGDVFAAFQKQAAIDTTPVTRFTYVPVPKDVAANLERVSKRILPSNADKQDIDHVTLLYVPDAEKALTEEHVDEIVSAFSGVCRKHHPIDARIQGWGYFDSAVKKGNTMTALVALVDAPGIESLHVELKNAVKKIGIEPSNSHVFTPHITLAYLPQGNRVSNLPILSGTFTIDEIVFTNAKLHHISLGANPLRKAACTYY